MQLGPQNKVCAFGRAESKVDTHQHQPRGVPKTVGKPHYHNTRAVAAKKSCFVRTQARVVSWGHDEIVHFNCAEADGFT